MRTTLWLASLGFALLVAAQPAAAQRSADEAPASATVRAELAAVLLNAGRYAEAAHEYGRLVQRDGRNTAYRMGLARALAWGNRHREAEAQLRILAGHRTGDVEVQKLLRSVRANITPTAREAGSWLSESPAYAPYRLALARALVQARRPADALHHYDLLLASRVTSELLREAANAHVAADDRPAAIVLIERHLARSPRDTGLVRLYAGLLAADRRYDAALAQYDLLFDLHPAPDVPVERARIEIQRRDLAAAEADLRRSVALAPTADAFLLLGDVHRWRSSYGEARAAYEAARSLRPRDREVAAAFAQLARDERPAAVPLAVPGEEQGTSVQVSAVHDNAGIDYARVGVRRGFGLRAGFTGSVGVEFRELSERTAVDRLASSGFAVEAAVARAVIHGPFYGAIGVSGAVVHHFGEQVMTAGGIGVRGAYEAWLVALDVSTGPAYPTLLTAASLMPPRLERRDPDDDDDEDDDRRGRGGRGGRGGLRIADSETALGVEPLAERRVTLSAGGPLGHADAAITWQRADISDGNRRSALTLSARYPLTAGFSAIYAGNAISYAQRSQLYWDPDAYVASAVGIAYMRRHVPGISVRVRSLVGAARADASPFLRVATDERGPTSTQLQLNLDSELGYRRGSWDVAAGWAYGRVGTYQRHDATLTVRLMR
jgi:tetratricopeptide (TPR) repeat protein